MSNRDTALLVTAVLGVLGSVKGWIDSDRERREKIAAYESYGEYTTDQLRRDEALLRALRDCQERRNLMSDAPGSQAQTVLDGIARSQGWAPEERQTK